METDGSGLFFLHFKTVKQPILLHSILETCKEALYVSVMKKKNSLIINTNFLGNKTFGKECTCKLQD
jgi:hypothetical protein